MQRNIQSTVGETRSPMRQAILILGMHRSGTSALGGVVGALGAAAPKTLNPANFANPRGYWESVPLMHANDELLASAGSRWDDWRQIDPEWVHSNDAKRHYEEIKKIIVDEFGDESMIFVKDPRICRFVPSMLSIFAELNISAVAFMPVRNPLEVAYSLRRRDNIALPKSLLLWLRHVLDAEYHSRHIPRHFLAFEKLLLDWRYEMNRAAEKTGLIWPARSDRSDADIDHFLTQELHHEKSTYDEIQNHREITSLVRETYNILTSIAANGESKSLLDRLDLVRTKFDEGCELFGAAVAAEELKVRQLRGELRAQVHENRNRAERMTAELQRLTAELQRSTAEHDALISVHNGLTAERDALASARNDLVVQYDALTWARDRLIAERDTILASSSWRLTAPLRSLRRLFAR